MVGVDECERKSLRNTFAIATIFWVVSSLVNQRMPWSLVVYDVEVSSTGRGGCVDESERRKHLSW